MNPFMFDTSKLKKNLAQGLQLLIVFMQLRTLWAIRA